MGQPIIFSRAMVAAASTGVSASQSPGAGAILINGTKATGGVATFDVQRRVILHSGSDDTGITFTVFGTNQSGAPIQETVTGGNGTDIQTNLDFLTVTKITHTGSVAGTLTAGTNGVGSSPWQILNWNQYPMDLTISVELRTGAANFTIEHTYDDPNILPGTGGLNASGLAYALAWPDATVNGASATIETAYQIPILAFRLTTNSGTGTLVCRAIQSGLGSP